MFTLTSTITWYRQYLQLATDYTFHSGSAIAMLTIIANVLATLSAVPMMRNVIITQGGNHADF